MKLLYVTVSLAAGCLICPQILVGATIHGQNWADEVADYTNGIQNYGGVMMDPSTVGWVLGPPDADLNGNGYAWDDGIDQDTVAGWRLNDSGEYIIVEFFSGLPDVEGNDIVVRMFCGSSAEASVLASVDGTAYTEIGSIAGQPGEVPGTPGWFYDAEFDFADAFGTEDAHYIKVERLTTGPGTGMFFDSFGSVPEPSTFTLLALAILVTAGGMTIARRRDHW